MDDGSTRIYFDYREIARDEYLSTIFWFIAFMSAITLVVGLILMPFIVPLISVYTEKLYIITIIAGIASVFVSFLMRILYNEQLSSLVFKHNILQTFFNHFTSFIFIFFLKTGVIGRQIGNGVGCIVNIFFLAKEFYKRNLFRLKVDFNKQMLKETVYLSFPGLVTTLQTMLFTYLDRIFLKIFYDNKTVGLYSLGFILGKGLSILYESISMALFPKVMQDLKEDYKKNIIQLEKFAYKYYVGLIFTTFILAINSKRLVILFSTEKYMEASKVLPFIIMGFMMSGFYKIPSLVLSYHKIVWFYPLLALFSFGINGFLNYLLIPKYEMIGAAFATFVGLYLYSIVIQLSLTCTRLAGHLESLL